MKLAETRFLHSMLAAHKWTAYKSNPTATRVPFVDELANDLGFPSKQALSWAEKWVRKGWWDYGVTLRSGWFTPEGIETLKRELRYEK